jgi:hypothetical protein
MTVENMKKYPNKKCHVVLFKPIVLIYNMWGIIIVDSTFFMPYDIKVSLSHRLFHVITLLNPWPWYQDLGLISESRTDEGSDMKKVMLWYFYHIFDYNRSHRSCDTCQQGDQLILFPVYVFWDFVGIFPNCVVLIFCVSSSSVPYIASLSGLSICDCRYGVI